MTIKKEVGDYWQLRDMLWDCDHILDMVEERDQEEQFMGTLEEIFEGEAVDLTELNDYIRFSMMNDFPDFFDDRR